MLLYAPQYFEMMWIRIFLSSFVRFFSSVLIRIFVLGLSSEPRIDRDVTYRGSNRWIYELHKVFARDN